MKVKRLIKLLERVENKDAEVEIAIRQYNKGYPIAYTHIANGNYLDQMTETVRIVTSLPENMRTKIIKEDDEDEA